MELINHNIGGRRTGDPVGRPLLLDSHGRHIHKLRVSITDACNFRCLYCMPEDAVFKPKSDLLTAAEIRDICAGLIDLGIDEIRITGGEPTVREEFEEIVLALSALPLKKLGLTSNGYLLDAKLPFLSETNCRHLNISLDSLNEKSFAGITKTKTFNRVYRTVLKARDMGFEVKVNAVLLKGENDGELLNFVDFSAREGIPVRFLELMKIGPMHRENEDKFMTAREAIDRIETRETLIPVSAPADSTAYYFDTAAGARIGFIASESEPFCGACSRLRLTDTGVLRACLMSCAGLNLRGKPREQYPEILRAVMALKPTGRIHHVDQPMHQIGG